MAERKRRLANSLLEWIAAAAGAAIALALLGIIGREALTGPGRGPAELEVTAERVVPAGRGVVVAVSVSNRGEATAAAVQIEGELRRGGETVETSRATLDYVPAGASRRAGLLFTRDPAGHRLELRATGYAEP